MLTSNVSQLDELPFLKRQKYRWSSEQQEGEKMRIRLLQHLRCMSYQCSPVMAKLFMFQKFIKKDTSNMKQVDQNNQENNQKQQQTIQLYEQLVVTTQKEIISLQKFFYLLNDCLPQQIFSNMVAQINLYVKRCKQYVRDQATSRFEVEFGGKQFLMFGVYMQKNNDHKRQKGTKNEKICFENNSLEDFRFAIKCSINTFVFTPFKDITMPKFQQPQQFQIIHPLVLKTLYQLYQELQSIPLTITQKSISQYINYFDTVQHLIDQEYLKLQVFKNYPLLRCKYYLPVVFSDQITNQKLDGPIFSNSNPQCMFGHFYGYNADTIKILQGNNCEQCHCLFEGVQQNPIMTHLRDNLFNPYKTDVLYCPQFNRFKLLKKVVIAEKQIEEPIIESNDLQQQFRENKPKYKTKITYLNYLHFRCNLRKMTTKKRNLFYQMLEYEKFPLTFDLWGRKLLIMDPVRGKNCTHYQFTDLRLVYMNKYESQNNVMYKCPICDDLMLDSDILYLREVEILVKYLKFKCSKFKQYALNGSCFVDHRQCKVFIEFKKPNKQTNSIETEIIEIKSFYQTLIDPYVSFNEYALGIPDKYQQKMRNKHLFGFDQQNEDKDSEDDFQYKYGGDQDFKIQKLSKKIEKISVENQIQEE